MKFLIFLLKNQEKMTKVVSEEANLHHLEADSTQLQVIRSKKMLI